MHKSILFTGILLLIAHVCAGQRPLFPVRVDHQWQFVDHFGEAPREFRNIKYDGLGDRYLPWNYFGKETGLSPFRLVEKDEKVGLLDNHLKRILECRYKRIRPLTNLYFAVELDSLFTVVDRSGKILIGVARYEKISSIDSVKNGVVNYFLVNRGGKWGIHQLNGDLLVAPQYADIRLVFSSNWFKVKINEKDELWNLIDEHNNLVFPKPFWDIRILTPKFIAVKFKKTDPWVIVDQNNKATVDGNWRKVSVISDKIAQIDSAGGGKSIIFNYQKESFSVIPNLADLILKPDGYIIVVRKVVGSVENVNNIQKEYYQYYYGLLGEKGEQIAGPYYHTVKNGGLPGVYLMNFQKYYRPDTTLQIPSGWQVYTRGEGFLNLHQSHYDSISIFKDSLAIVKKDTAYGVINLSGQEVVPIRYRAIVIKDGFVNAYNFDFTPKTYRSRSRGKLLPAESSVNHVTIEPPLDYYYDATLPPIAYKYTSIYAETKQNIFIDNAKSLKDTSSYAAVGRLTLGRFVHEVYYHKKKIAKNAFTADLTSYEPRSFSLMTIDTVKLPDMIGIRWDDGATKSVFSFLDPDGKMGFVSSTLKTLGNKKGLPEKFTYIGEPQFFGKSAILVRVCSGGKLSTQTSKEAPACTTTKQIRDKYYLHKPSTPVIESGAKNLYAVPDGDSLPKWGVLNLMTMRYIVEPKYDFIEPFDTIAELAFVKKDGKYSALNLEGKEVLPFQKEKMILFNGFFKQIKVKPLSYMFNASGHQIGEVKYLEYRGFFDGLCAVRDTQLKWGFIDVSGKEVIPCKYKAVENFSEGLAAVMDSSNMWTFVRLNGATAFFYGKNLLPKATGWQKNYEEKINKENAKTLRFRDGRCLFFDPKLARWGYLNKSGDTIVNARYSAATEFSNGRALVRNAQIGGKIESTLIDTTGLPLSLSYFYIWPYNVYGIAVACEKKGGPRGLIDTQGLKKGPMQYDSICTFFEGYAAAEIKNKWGVIRWDGQPVTPFIYESIDTMSEGCIAVKQNERWYYIDSLGNRMFGTDTYASANRFLGGLADVNGGEVIDKNGKKMPFDGKILLEHLDGFFILKRKDNNKVICADARGNNVFDYEFDNVTGAKNGLILISPDKKGIGAINRRGFTVIQPKFKSVGLKNEYFFCQTTNLQGLLDRNGVQVVPPQFDKIQVLPLSTNSNDLTVIRAEFGEEVYYFKYYYNKYDKTEQFWPRPKE